MTTFVIDAGIAIKWVVEEDGTEEALALRQKSRLIAPELLVGECANILWKKVQRCELVKDEALLAARLLQAAEFELMPMRSLFEAATRMSIEIDHPAYDCVYLALAAESQCRFVTADERLVRKLRQSRNRALGNLAVTLIEASRGLGNDLETTGHGVERHEMIAQAFEAAPLSKRLGQVDVMKHIAQRGAIALRKHKPHHALLARANEV